MSYMNEYAKCTKVTSHYAIFISVHRIPFSMQCGGADTVCFNFTCWLLVKHMPAKVVRAFRMLVSNLEFLYLPRIIVVPRFYFIVVGHSNQCLR